MKKNYVTQDSIKKYSQSLLAELSYYNKMAFNRELLENCALMVVDMQKYFLDTRSKAYFPAADAVLPGIVNLVKFFNVNNLPVIFTRHANTPHNAGRMETWYRGVMRENDPANEIIDELVPFTSQILVKPQYDCFLYTDLSLRLKNIDTILITGIMTHLCVESTARGAFMRNFNVIIPIDCTATYNDDIHKGSLRNMAHACARLCMSDDIIEMLD